MRLTYIIVSLIFSSVVINAQSNDAVNIKDSKAEAILDKISAQFNQYTSIEMDVELEMEFPGNEPEVQKGKIIQAKDKYFVDLGMQAIYCDGESLWIHMKNNKEVQWNNAVDASEGGFMDPKTLLSLYKSGDFAYAITNETKENNENITQIEFKPLDNDTPYSKMRLTLNKDNQSVKRMKVFSKDGSKYTLHIKNIKTNLTYPQDTFVFSAEKYPGVHVEDLRM